MKFKGSDFIIECKGPTIKNQNRKDQDRNFGRTFCHRGWKTELEQVQGHIKLALHMFFLKIPYKIFL